MDKKKIMQLIAFILGVIVLIKIILVQDDRDRSTAPSWDEVERAFNDRNSKYEGDVTNPHPINEQSQ